MEATTWPPPPPPPTSELPPPPPPTTSACTLETPEGTLQLHVPTVVNFRIVLLPLTVETGSHVVGELSIRILSIAPPNRSAYLNMFEIRNLTGPVPSPTYENSREVIA